MVGWHHRFNGLEFEQTLGDGEGQETWGAAVHVVTKSWTQLGNQTTTNIKSKGNTGFKSHIRLNSIIRYTQRIPLKSNKTHIFFKCTENTLLDKTLSRP